ncbi:MAG: WG repeat-containing protein [Candidatus Peregrinibacteria bacterium]
MTYKNTITSSLTLFSLTILLSVSFFSGCSFRDFSEDNEHINIDQSLDKTDWDLDIRNQLCKQLSAYVVYDFHEGFARVQNNPELGGWYYIDMDGKKLVDQEFDNAQDFNDGFALVKEKNKYYFINTKGKNSFNKTFDYADSFYSNLALVSENNNTYLINTTGNTVLEGTFDRIWNLKDGSFVIEKDRKNFLLSSNADKQLIKKPLKEILEGMLLYYFEGATEDILLVAYGNPSDGPTDYFFLNKEGEKIIDRYFDNAHLFSEGTAAVEKDGKWFFIDVNGDLIFDKKFDYAESFSNGLALVKENNRFSYIDKNGDTILDDNFEAAGSFYEGLANIFSKNGESYFINRAGNRFCSETYSINH